MQNVTLENGEVHQFPDDATPDEINSALSSVNQVPIQNKNNLISMLADNPVTNSILGAGDAFRNALGSSASILPGINISPVQSSSGTAYQLGNIAGNLGTFLGGGEALESARAASEGIPYLGKLSQYLGGEDISGAVRRIIGSGIGGALENQNNREEGALTGSALSGGFESLPYALSAMKGTGGLLKKAINSINPLTHSEQTINDLGYSSGLSDQDLKGGQALEKNGKLLAENVKQNYDQNYEGVKKDYAVIFKYPGLASSSIYNKVNPIIGTSEVGAYDSMLPSEDPYDNSTLNNLHNKFINNPTLQNAHDLQSELGSEIGYLTRKKTLGNADNDDKTQLSLIGQSRDNLKQDIFNFLGKQQANLDNQYEVASDNYLQNIVPYHSDNDLKEMAQGKLQNPTSSQIKNIFQNPEQSINKVVSDLGESGKSQILFNEIGKLNKSNLTPQKLINSYESLDNKGLGSYLTNNFNTNMNLINGKMDKSSVMQKLVGALTASQIGKFFGGSAGETIGALSGMLFSPTIMKYSPSISNVAPMGNVLANYLAKGYNPIKSTVIANQLPSY